MNSRRNTSVASITQLGGTGGKGTVLQNIQVHLEHWEGGLSQVLMQDEGTKGGGREGKTTFSIAAHQANFARLKMISALRSQTARRAPAYFPGKSDWRFGLEEIYFGRLGQYLRKRT